MKRKWNLIDYGSQANVEKESLHEDHDDTQFDGSQMETQDLFQELFGEAASSSSSSSSTVSASTPAIVAAISTAEHSGQSSTGSLTVSSTSAGPSKRKSKTAAIEFPIDLAAAAALATKEEEGKKGEKVDLTAAFAEGRAAEIEVQKSRLQFDIDCQREEGEAKRRKLEQDERRFEREKRWKLEENRAKDKDRKAQFVLEMAKDGKTPAEIKAMWELMMDD